MARAAGPGWSDDHLRVARQALEVNEPAAALGWLAGVRDNPELRTHYAAFLAGPGLAAVPAVQDRAARQPADPDVFLLLGALLSRAATEARGSDIIARTSEEQIRGLMAFSREARQALHRAAALHPADPAPWCELLSVAMSAGQYDTEVADMWQEIERRRGGHLYDAATTRLLTLTRKWGGSEEECFAFARDRTRESPPGHPLLALVALAHVEALVDRTMRSDLKIRTMWHLLRYPKKPAVRAELDAASDRLLAGAAAYASHPAAAAAHQAFACMYDHAYDRDRARAHLQWGGDRSAGWPWVYFGEETFGRAREAAGLPA